MITYEDKIALYENTDIANINKVTASDMNEIKNVVNGMIESGSNNNGSWIKYSDGTMICYRKIEKTVAITDVYGTLYKGIIEDINFPQSFVSIPYCLAQNNGANHIIIGQCQAVSTTKIGKLEIWSSIATTTYVIPVIIAIGKWK